MTKARKMTVERASSRIVSSELLGWMKFRFSDAWLHPRKARIGTRISRTIRKILRRWAGSGFMFETRNWKIETGNSKYETRGGDLRASPSSQSPTLENRNWRLAPNFEFRVSSFAIFQEFPQGTFLTVRHVPVAKAFGRLYQQGVKLIEQRFVRRQMLVKELLRGRVICRGGKKLMARKDAARVSIRNKYGLPPGIEQNRVGGFRADSFERQKLRAGASGALSKKRV